MKSVYSIGCSWIHEFNMQLAKSKKIQGCGSVTAPKRSQGLYSEGLAGHGLNHIKEILKFSSEMSEYQEKDVLLVQLPTPVRGILRDGHRPRTNTNTSLSLGLGDYRHYTLHPQFRKGYGPELIMLGCMAATLQEFIFCVRKN